MEHPLTNLPDAFERMSPRLYRWLVVACAVLGMFLVSMDVAVNVALPTITEHFDTDIRTIQWIIVTFIATRAGLALVAGSVGDQIGLRRIYLAGAVCYTVAVAVIAVSPSLGAVFGLRVLQGVGAGSLYAVAPAIASMAYTSENRGAALGIITAGFALGTLAGTLGAGVLVDSLGWESIFLGRLPFCAIALLLGWMVLGRGVPAAGRPSFDIVGGASLVAAVVALVFALQMSDRLGWESPLVVGSLVATPLLLALFLRSELTARWPVLDLKLFRLPGFRGACLGTFLLHLGVFVIWFVFPFYVADALGRGALFLGAMMAVMAAAMLVASPVGGRLSDRVDPKYVGIGGALAVGLGLFWMSFLDGSSSVGDVGVRMAVVGFGLGAFQSALYSMALKAVPAERLGTVSGVLSLVWALGWVLSVAIGGLVFDLRGDHHLSVLAGQGLPPDQIEAGALVLAFRDTFRLGAAVVGAGLVVLVITGVRRGPTELLPKRRPGL